MDERIERLEREVADLRQQLGLEQDREAIRALILPRQVPV
jgi:hypothetical protein